MNIIVEIKGQKNGQDFWIPVLMEAEPEESLVQIVDRIEVDLDDFKVKSITFLD